MADIYDRHRSSTFAVLRATEPRSIREMAASESIVWKHVQARNAVFWPRMTCLSITAAADEPMTVCRICVQVLAGNPSQSDMIVEGKNYVNGYYFCNRLFPKQNFVSLHHTIIWRKAAFV